MEIIPRLYLYNKDNANNGFKGNDYSKYILAASSNADNLDDTLDTAEITLVGLPFRQQFTPKAKFILEYYQKGETEKLMTTLHMVVKNDAVEQPILSNNKYFTHKLTLIEAGALAQGRVVDDFSVTYKLKDVSLDVKPTYDTTRKINVIKEEPADRFGNIYYGLLADIIEDGKAIDVYNAYTNFSFDEDGYNNFINQINEVEKLTTNTEIENNKEVTLSIPTLNVIIGNGFGITSIAGDADLNVKIYKTNIINSFDRELILNQDIGSATTVDNWVSQPVLAGEENPLFFTKGFVVGNVKVKPGILPARFEIQASKVADVYNTQLNRNRDIKFTIIPGYNYSIEITRITYESGEFALDGRTQRSEYFENLGYTKTINQISKCKKYSGFALEEENSYPYYANSPSISFNFNARSTIDANSILVKSAPPTNAYNLFLKSQIASNLVDVEYKEVTNENGEIVQVPKQFYEYDFPYKVENRDELIFTPIIESIFVQKNLWEIFMEIGKYIHARPFVTFGNNDDFILKWKYYGRTDKHEDKAHKISVFNSQLIEEYISAINSYVYNVVQLGGSVTETIIPSTISEDYLVYNDKAVLKTNKPILEIINMTLKAPYADGYLDYDMTPYIYEESIYKLLDIVKNVKPNKGLAIYYKLGSNSIEGLTYRLPQVNAGDKDNDYAIKNIIGELLNMSASDRKNTKVTNFAFSITYRTQDNIRSTQLRPDLRKYLLTCSQDKMPLHIQFNNQNDKMVDTENFGTNNYGKLVRTGNTIYETMEWVENISDLKHSGELYIINGEWVYVSRVNNIYFPNHIQSKVEFTKDFNRLSQIIGIPSEPRFYEISERSNIQRNIEYTDNIMLTTTRPALQDPKKDKNFLNFVTRKMFNRSTNRLGDIYYTKTTFTDIIDNSYKKEIIKPINQHYMSSTMTLSWEMEDNFSAGDQTINVEQPYSGGGTEPPSYLSLKPYQYPDVYGRADMCQIDFMKGSNIGSLDNIRKLPAYTSSTKFTPQFGTAPFLLNKDNREALSFNYSIGLISDSDRFVISNKLWGADGMLKVGVSFREEVNKLSTGYINQNMIDKSTLDIKEDFLQYENGFLTISLKTTLDAFLTQEEQAKIKSIIIYKKVPDDSTAPNAGQATVIIARNVTGENAFPNTWYIKGISLNDFMAQDTAFNNKFKIN